MKEEKRKEDVAEDYCFVCKDGGHLRVCDFKNCLKAYHPNCVGKEDIFLETDENWTCGLHSCFICHKSSRFQCICCPNSLCRACVRAAEFVQVKKRTRGFCNNCLKLTILIEENNDVDSDGDQVDFQDRETFEFLFKDYWDLIKVKEGLTLDDLHAADARLKRGEIHKSGSDSDKMPEEESMSEADDMEDTPDDGNPFPKSLKKNRSGLKTTRKGSKMGKKTFIGWGSEELISFLASIGKDTKEPLSQLEINDIIKVYVENNNLFRPDKKRKKEVICDEKLRTLFRKKKVKLYKVYNLLEGHLAENTDSDDEDYFSSEEDDDPIGNKRRRRINSDSKFKSEPSLYRKKVVEPPRSEYAALVERNIKSVYLRKSLVVHFLKEPEAFEDKVTGCFVRVKSDPKDFHYSPHKLFQLGQVKGINKVPQAYKVGETWTEIVLCVTNMLKDIPISSLSDADFEEEECEDLKQLVKKGLLERPLVVELNKKIRSVHEDIMSHWIDREIVRLKLLIDRANEKGWRAELFEYIDQRELLRKPSERTRLMKEIPSVIADMEEELDTNGTHAASTRQFGMETEQHKLAEPYGTRSKEASVKANVRKTDEGDKTSLEIQIINLEEIDEEQQQKPEEANVILSKEELDKSDGRKADQGDTMTSEKPIIDLDEDAENTSNSLRETMWHYKDPKGAEQGPFSLTALRSWRERGFFGHGFKVWEADRSIDEAILLTDALARHSHHP